MKKLLLLSLLMGLGQFRAEAAYFRFEPGKDVQGLVALPLGGGIKGGALYGSKTSVFKHHHEDGFLLIPGVDWSLLDAGFVKPDTQKNLIGVFGPSMDTSEPLKAILLSALKKATGEDVLAGLKYLLRPASPGDKSVTVNLGAGLAVDPGDLKDSRNVRGAPIFTAGLQARF